MRLDSIARAVAVAVPVRRLLATAVLVAAMAPSQAIVGATPSTAFAAVGRGVQVTPDWVLTTRHSTYEVGDIYTNAYGSRVVLARYDAPGSDTAPANDLSLLRLAPSASKMAFMPITIDSRARGDSGFPALAATIVSAQNSGPARGYAFTTIDQSVVQMDPDDDGPQGMVTVNYLVSHDSQVYVQAGDSSGALFAGQVTDTGVLMGITSTLFTDVNGTPVGSGFVALAPYRSWLDATMAADTADNQVLRWTANMIKTPVAIAPVP